MPFTVFLHLSHIGFHASLITRLASILQKFSRKFIYFAWFKMRLQSVCFRFMEVITKDFNKVRPGPFLIHFSPHKKCATIRLSVKC